ncbi:MAG: DUF4956 domain-containing protein [Balneolaceae bacterium]|nr:DUF4956 domain-containing protein [Balneolaceae bacterium]
MDDLLVFGDTAPMPTELSTLLLGLLLAFLCGQIIAWFYMYTHTGVSYSRTFVSSLIVLPITVSLVMLVLDNNLITAFSLLVVFAIVRFRNILRDTLDTVFILAVIVIGMACGTQKFTTALFGTLISSLALVYIWFTNFGSRQRYDLILNLDWTRLLSEVDRLEAFPDRHAFRITLASQRSSDDENAAHLSYRLLLLDPEKVDKLLQEARGLAGVTGVSSLKAEDESEV